MEAKETYLFLCPNGGWLRGLLGQINRNTTVECQVIDFFWGWAVTLCTMRAFINSKIIKMAFPHYCIH